MSRMEEIVAEDYEIRLLKGCKGNTNGLNGENCCRGL